MAANDARQQAVLAAQLAMNEQTWQALQAHGAGGDSELRLDFFYDAPNHAQADALAAFIQRETDYDVSVNSSGGGLLRKKDLAVTGTTQPTRVSQDILDQWVTWMVAAGFEYGCEFDGWGAQMGAS